MESPTTKNAIVATASATREILAQVEEQTHLQRKQLKEAETANMIGWLQLRMLAELHPDSALEDMLTGFAGREIRERLAG